MGFGGFGPAQGVFGGDATFTNLTVTGAATFAATVTATGRITAAADILLTNNVVLTGVSAGSGQALGYSTLAVQFGSNADGAFLGSAFLFSANGNYPATTCLTSDAAGVLAQRNGTAAQENRTYARYDSATKYHRTSMRSAIGTASAVSGASVALTGLIPDGAVVVGVTTEVATGLGVTGGTTGYQVGDGTDPDRWGAITGTAAGTKSDNTNATATTVQMFVAANDVVLTAVGGNFDGTGAIRVTVHYLIAEAAYA